MLAKRLCKKPSFLVILLLIPLVAGLYAAATAGQSGVVTVALAAEDPADPMAAQVIGRLTGSSQLIEFVTTDPETARNLVLRGKVDCAWLFPAEMSKNVEKFVKNPTDRNAFVTVCQREDSTLLRMAREKLSGELFEVIARTQYLLSLREDAPELSDQQLLAYRDAVDIPGSLFAFDDGGLPAPDTGFLLSPIRGLLAVVMLLAGMASAMYTVADRERGTFSWLPASRQPLAEFSQMLVALTLVGIAAGISLWVSGLSHGLLEIPVMILYILQTAVFCFALLRLLGTVSRLAVCLPLLLTLCLAVCPVFFDLVRLTKLQYLFPPTYFIAGIREPRYLLLTIPYSLLCLALLLPGAVLQYFRKRG